MHDLSPDDAQHLQLLSICHYVVGGLLACLSLFALVYIGLGIFFLNMPSQPNEPGPPAMVGPFMIGFGVVGFLFGEGLAISVIMVGRALARRTNYWLAFVVGCFECMVFPFGTVLGVFTIIVLSRTAVRAAFGLPPAATLGPPVPTH